MDDKLTASPRATGRCICNNGKDCIFPGEKQRNRKHDYDLLHYNNRWKFDAVKAVQYLSEVCDADVTPAVMCDLLRHYIRDEELPNLTYYQRLHHNRDFDGRWWNPPPTFPFTMQEHELKMERGRCQWLEVKLHKEFRQQQGIDGTHHDWSRATPGDTRMPKLMSQL